jgi:glycosyltransferase involved in cell wall biosynthesis
MKVCIVSEFFPPRILGGGEYAAYNIGRGLAAFGHEVNVLTSHPHSLLPHDSSRDLPIHEFKDGMNIHRILGVKTLRFKFIDLTAFCRHEFFFIHSLLTLLIFFSRTKPDIIHAMNIESIPPSVLAARICGIPVVVTVNSSAVKCLKGDRLDLNGNVCNIKCGIFVSKNCMLTQFFSLRSWRGLLFLEAFLWWSMIKFFIRHSNKIIAISRFIRNSLIQDGFQAEKIRLTPEFFDPNFGKSQSHIEGDEKAFNRYSDNKIVLYPGAVFDSRKGSDVLLEAIPMVLRRVPNTKFVITGIVPDEQREEIMKRNLHDSVIFVGLVSREKLPLIYEQADLVVCPSVVPEAFGLVILEAMSMKKPVVASRIGGIPDIISNEVNGLLVTPSDPNDLAKAIIRLLTDEQLAKRLSQLGSRMVERFSERTILNKLTTVYQELSKE